MAATSSAVLMYVTKSEDKEVSSVKQHQPSSCASQQASSCSDDPLKIALRKLEGCILAIDLDGR